ncbi:MAG: hypothetical protein H7A51_13660 [Akkermansiaceae bacterium]|nr:hypothetical protein [Akkermansiaceae bacterium]
MARRRNGSRFRYAPSPAVAAGSGYSSFYRQIFTLPRRCANAILEIEDISFGGALSVRGLYLDFFLMIFSSISHTLFTLGLLFKGISSAIKRGLMMTLNITIMYVFFIFLIITERKAQPPPRKW